MFELHVVVGGIVMFNIIELIMKIMPNYPTQRTCIQGKTKGLPCLHMDKLYLLDAYVSVQIDVAAKFR
jgi:hypothetical protein